ncbi:MAG: DcrB-related protein [Pyrinomonadaceae bacterium]|nr:DcrB-related protein [Pyrinomonadaceae bacterium]
MRFIANGFMTEVPDGWEDRSLLMLVGPVSRTDFAANVVFTREPVDTITSVEDYAAEVRQRSRAEVGALEILDEQATTINEFPAYQWVQQCEIAGRRLRQLQTCILTGGVVFTGTCSAEIEEFDAHVTAFRQIISMFQPFELEDVEE